MKKIYFFLIIAGFCLLQATFMDYFRFFNLKPDLLLICAVIAALYFKPSWAIAFCFLAGLLKDTFSASPFGINTLLFCLSGLIILRLSKEISVEDNLTRMGLLLIVALFNNIITAIILYSCGLGLPLGIFLRITVFGSLYTAMLLPLILRLIKPVVCF